MKSKDKKPKIEKPVIQTADGEPEPKKPKE
jgi:hypothetical protein